MDKVERWYREADALFRQGERVRADRLCAKVLDRAPGHVGALWLSGWLRAAARDAAGAEARFSRARELAPEHPEIAYRLGLAQYELDRYVESAASFEAAIRLGADRCEVHRALGHARWQLGRPAEARARFEAAFRADPGDRPSLHNLLFCSYYDPDLAPEARKRLHVDWGSRYVAGISARSGPHPNPPDPDRTLKVGYLSPDFRAHPVAAFVEPLLGRHDPAAVEVTGYASVPNPDAVTRRLQGLAHRWRDVHALPDAAVAAQVERDGIDILVDLAGFTGSTRLRVLGYRPAPVQASYLGYPGTTGLEAVGWRLTDAVANPPGTEGFYTERLVRIAGGFCAYAPPPDAPEPGPLPLRARGRPTFASFLNPNKITDATVALWSRVLEAVGEARLMLFRHNLEAPSTREDLLARFQAHGVSRERIEFGWDRPSPAGGGYMEAYGRADVVLDTVPFNGHTSTCEALWMGVPVVTLAGDDFAGRLSAAVLEMADLGDLVGATPEAFVEVAARLAGDADRLEGLRRGLRDRLRGSRLLDAAACTRSLEAAYREMWRDWCAGRADA